MEILLVIDNGLSGTKAFWNVPGKPVNFMKFTPEILEVSSRNLLDSGLESGRPEDNAIIELADGGLFAVGVRARELRGKSPIEETKYQMSTFKIVACVGAIAKSLGTSKLEVSIATLLPFSEYQDRKGFVEMVKKQLKEFKFQDKTVNCKVETVSVKPEGAGLAIAYMNECEEFENQNTLVLMIGHRDASCLPFAEGVAPQGLGDQLGEQLGFLEFQQQVVKRASLNVKAKDQARLPEYLFRGKAEPEYIERLARMVVSRDVKTKTEEIERAIRDSEAWYCETLTNWISTTLGPFLYEVDQVVISGGTALYLQEELTNFFLSLPNLNHEGSVQWSGLESKGAIESLIHKTLTPELAVRLADVYGLYTDTVEALPNLKPGNEASTFKTLALDTEFEPEETEAETRKSRAQRNGASLPSIPKTVKG